MESGWTSRGPFPPSTASGEGPVTEKTTVFVEPGINAPSELKPSTVIDAGSVLPGATSKALKGSVELPVVKLPIDTVAKTALTKVPLPFLRVIFTNAALANPVTRIVSPEGTLFILLGSVDRSFGLSWTRSPGQNLEESHGSEHPINPVPHHRIAPGVKYGCESRRQGAGRHDVPGLQGIAGDDLAAGARAQRPPDREVHRLGDEPSVAISEENMCPPSVEASGGPGPLLGRFYVYTCVFIRWQGVIIKRISEASREPACVFLVRPWF